MKNIKRILSNRLHRDNGLHGSIVNYLRLLELQIERKEEIDMTIIPRVKGYLKDMSYNKDQLWHEIIKELEDESTKQ